MNCKNKKEVINCAFFTRHESKNGESYFKLLENDYKRQKKIILFCLLEKNVTM